VGEQHVNGGHQAHHPTAAHARFEPGGVKTDHVGEVPKLSVGTKAFSVPGLMAGLSPLERHPVVVITDKNDGQAHFLAVMSLSLHLHEPDNPNIKQLLNSCVANIELS
jgi:hypothetical protein